MNGTTSTFTYRGDGLRDSRTVGITTTTFTWDINAALPVVLDDGNRYVYGAGLEAMLTATGTYYYLADGLGSTMAIADSTGIVAKSYTYDVYGKPTSTGALPNEYDFAGQQTDPTGLQYLRARYMDPATGTFLSRDPLGAEPAWTASAHAYAGSNPTNFVDPTGLCHWWDIPCQLRELSGLNESEWSYCHRGPITAMRCKQAHDDANAAVNTTAGVFSDDPDGNRARSFRHCLWSGLMACRWGTGQAKVFGDLHEQRPGNPETEKQWALHNNALGRLVGEYYRGRPNARGLIADECLRAAFDGRLITDPDVFDKGGFDAADVGRTDV